LKQNYSKQEKNLGRRKLILGYWKDHLLHPYKRRAVERDVVQFDGWEKLVELCNRLESNRDKALFQAIFSTGGRINEVLSLKKENFAVGYEDKYLLVQNMTLSKRYLKTHEYQEWIDSLPETRLKRLYKFDEEKKQYSRRRFETEKVNAIRSPFVIPLNEPLMPKFLEQIEASESYLFIGRSTEKPMSRNWAYKIITKTGLYPHYLRGQKASCLIAFYGMTMEEMMEYMGWEEIGTARHYAKMGIKGLSKHFENVVYPKV